MFLEMIVAAGGGWYLARKYGNATSGLRTAVANLCGTAKSSSDSLVADIAARLKPKTNDDVRVKAQLLADTSVAAVFESATPEEKEAFLSAFSRYCERTD